MTGGASELGVSGRNGFNLAVREINEKGGIRGMQIVPIIKDDGSNPATAIGVVESFVNEAYPISLAFFTSSMMPVVLESMDKYDVMFMSPTMSTSKLDDMDDRFLRVFPSHIGEIKELYELIELNDSKRVAFFI